MSWRLRSLGVLLAGCVALLGGESTAEAEAWQTIHASACYSPSPTKFVQGVLYGLNGKVEVYCPIQESSALTRGAALAVTASVYVTTLQAATAMPRAAMCSALEGGYTATCQNPVTTTLARRGTIVVSKLVGSTDQMYVNVSLADTYQGLAGLRVNFP